MSHEALTIVKTLTNYPTIRHRYWVFPQIENPLIEHTTLPASRFLGFKISKFQNWKSSQLRYFTVGEAIAYSQNTRHQKHCFETTILWIQRLSAWPENWNRLLGSTGTECLRRQFCESSDFQHDLKTGTDQSVPPEPSVWDDSSMNPTTFCMTWKLEPTTRFHRNRVFETTVSWI